MSSWNPDYNRRGRLFGPSMTSFLALRWPVLATMVVVWNGLFLFAFWLNGSWGFDQDPRAAAVVGGASLALGVFGIAVAASERFRLRVTAPSRRHRYEAGAFVLLVVIALVLGMVIMGLAVRLSRLP